MNKNSLILAAALAVSATVILFSGCASTPANTQTEQVLVTTAAAGAAEIAITQDKQHPAQTAAEFAAGSVILSGIVGGNSTLTVAEVNSILVMTGQTNSTVQLIEPLVVNLLNAYSNGSTNGVVLNASAAQLLGWVATGFAQGVAATGH